VTTETEALVQITNRRENTPMDLADGHGGLVHLAPNETKTVRGDLMYFKRAAKDIGGLVVKPAPSTVTRADHDRSPGRSQIDVHKVRVYNYRDIPLRLATGVDRQYADIPRAQLVEDPKIKGKKTKVPGQVVCVARVSLIKQMSGIKVDILDADEKKPTEEKKEAPKEVVHEREIKPKLRVNSDPNTPSTSEPRSADISSLRAKLELPDTKEAFIERTKQITWHDLRGICTELGYSRPKSREHATELICQTLYPEAETEEGNEDPEGNEEDNAPETGEPEANDPDGDKGGDSDGSEEEAPKVEKKSSKKSPKKK